MLKIITNKIISEQIYNVPKLLPNNLELIKMNYGISTLEIAQSLGLNRNFVGTVAKENANFSGISVIRFIKHFNVPFNLIYSVNKELNYIENTHTRFICIFQIDNNYTIETEEQIEGLNRDLLIEAYKSVIPQHSEWVAKFILEVTNNTITYTNGIKSDNYNNDLLKYQEIVGNLDYDYNKYRYFALAYELIKDINVTKNINLQKNIDIGLIRYLDSKSFTTNKYKTINISKIDLEFKDGTFYLPEEYSMLINDEIIVSDKIKDYDCTVKRNTIEFTIVSYTISEITKLKYLREYKNYSTRDMADKLCLSEDTYIAIEKGYQKISAQTMWKMELELGVLLNSILNIDEYYNKYCVD